MALQSPCYNPEYHTECPNRFVGCHSVCERFKAYEQAKVLEYNKRKRIRDTLEATEGYIKWSRLRYEKRYK